MSGYGAIENKPKGGVVMGAVVGVILLAGLIGGIIYYQTSERRRLDRMDYDTLNVEHDALKAVTAPLRELADAAQPETAPDAYATLLANAQSAYALYAAKPRRTSPLPSGRPWPGQFDAADKLVKDSLDHFKLVSYYLDQRAKAKPSKVSGTVNVDTDIQNVSDMATGPLNELEGLLSRMQTQRDDHAWEYGPAPKPAH